jgi:hypothetical protein
MAANAPSAPRPLVEVPPPAEQPPLEPVGVLQPVSSSPPPPASAESPPLPLPLPLPLSAPLPLPPPYGLPESLSPVVPESLPLTPAPLSGVEEPELASGEAPASTAGGGVVVPESAPPDVVPASGVGAGVVVPLEASTVPLGVPMPVGPS